MFSTFIMGLASATLMDLGLIPGPIKNEVKQNLESARSHIELLGMLHEKTRGNLSPEEKELLEKVVTDLKLQFARSSAQK